MKRAPGSEQTDCALAILTLSSPSPLPSPLGRGRDLLTSWAVSALQFQFPRRGGAFPSLPRCEMRGDCNQTEGTFPNFRRSPPLPGGEGRGEGKRKCYTAQNLRVRPPSETTTLLLRTLRLLCFSFFANTAFGAADEIPPLRPPRAEFHPSFWEQHSVWLVAAAIIIVGTAAFWILRLRQPTPVPVTPPEEIPRRALEPLRGRAEDAALVAEVSQIMRGYVISAFGLPPDELTTGELIKSLQSCRQASPELTDAIEKFLRPCDERKFAPSSSPAAPINAVATALQLISRIETHRGQIPVANPPTEPAAASPRAV